MVPRVGGVELLLFTNAKTRKYDEAYLALSFTSMTLGSEERPQCVVSMKILAADILKPNKLRCWLETRRPEHKVKPVDFFERKLINCRAQRSLFSEAAFLPSNAQPASYKVAYRVAQCKKLHTIAEELILPSATDIPLSNNTIGRCIHDISKDTEEQLNNKVWDSRHFALPVDEATDGNRDCLLIMHIRYIDADELREDLLFYKQLIGRATADEMFKIIDT